MLNWKFEVITSVGKTPPTFAVLSNNNNSLITLAPGTSVINFESSDYGQLVLDFFSKNQNDTIVENGQIVKDTYWRITKIWCDDILLELWFLHDCVYYPKYFPGFLESNPTSPKIIQSPYQFNFPGTIEWKWNKEDFWLWYFHEKNNREVINFLDKDPDRVWKFRGSTDDCNDLVSGIKRILDL